jgi:hypothetical protein
MFLAAPAGDYEISVSGSGFQTYTEDITVGAPSAEVMVKDLNTTGTAAAPKSE